MVLLAIGLSACGSNGSSSSGSGQVRLVNTTHSHAALALSVSGTSQIATVAANSASAFSAVGAGNPVLTITDAGSQTALATLSPTVTGGQSYTAFVYESSGAVHVAWTVENDAAPSAGTANLRVMTAAADAGPLDVYVTAPNVPLSSVGSPSFALQTPAGTLYSTFNNYTPGTYEVRVTAAGNKSDVRLDIPSITLGDQQNATVTLTPTTGGVLLDGGLLVEQGSFAGTVNTLARVRLVSGVNGGVVGASDGALAVEAGAVSPVIDGYVSAPSGSTVWTATVGGQAVAVPPITLAAGTDYTVLVSGSAGSYVASLVTDDNHAPTVAGSERIRLINALGGTAAGLSMTVDFTSVASNIVPGQSSAYAAVQPDASTRVEITSPQSVTPVSLQTGLNFTAGNVYTVFVLGDASSPQVIVRKDR